MINFVMANNVHIDKHIDPFIKSWFESYFYF